MEKDKNNKEVNQIKIGARTRVRNVISYALILFKERNFNEVVISAIGGAIGSLVNAVEVIKSDIKVYQNNKISTVSYQTMDSNEKIIQERLYPKMEVVLSKEEPKNKNEGYQGMLGEEERKVVKEFMDKRKETRERTRNDGDYQRGGRGMSRGGRGMSRGGRGMSRGNGYGNRGGDRGSPRGGRGFGGNRGGRGAPRGFGGNRGGRGAPRGFGGNRGGNRGNNSRRGSMDRDRPRGGRY